MHVIRIDDTLLCLEESTPEDIIWMCRDVATVKCAYDMVKLTCNTVLQKHRGTPEEGSCSYLLPGANFKLPYLPNQAQ